MASLRDWILVFVAAFLVGLFALSAGCNVDGERWNHAMNEAWQSLGIGPDEPDTGFTMFIPGDVLGFVAPDPDPAPD